MGQAAPDFGKARGWKPRSTSQAQGRGWCESRGRGTHGIRQGDLSAGRKRRYIKTEETAAAVGAVRNRM